MADFPVLMRRVPCAWSWCRNQSDSTLLLPEPALAPASEGNLNESATRAAVTGRQTLAALRKSTAIWTRRLLRELFLAPFCREICSNF